MILLIILGFTLGLSTAWLLFSTKCMLLLRDAEKQRAEAAKEYRQAKELHEAYQAAMRGLPRDSICLRTL